MKAVIKNPKSGQGGGGGGGLFPPIFWRCIAHDSC